MYRDTFFSWLLLISLSLSLSTLLMEPNISLLLPTFLASTSFFSSRTKQSFVYVSIHPIIVAKTSVFFLLIPQFYITYLLSNIIFTPAVSASSHLVIKQKHTEVRRFIDDDLNKTDCGFSFIGRL